MLEYDTVSCGSTCYCTDWYLWIKRDCLTIQTMVLVSDWIEVQVKSKAQDVVRNTFQTKGNQYHLKVLMAAYGTKKLVFFYHFLIFLFNHLSVFISVDQPFSDQITNYSKTDPANKSKPWTNQLTNQAANQLISKQTKQPTTAMYTSKNMVISNNCKFLVESNIFKTPPMLKPAHF